MTTTYGGLTYANGAVPAAVLAPLTAQPDAFLRRDAAEAWNRGRQTSSPGRASCSRCAAGTAPWAEQERESSSSSGTRPPQATGDGPYDDVRWWNGRRYVRYGTAAAAIPGTSNHGWGLAVDVIDYGNVRQFDYPRRALTFPILARHGWTDAEGRGSIQEPWHLVYDPTRDTPDTGQAGPDPPGDDDVILYLKGDKAPSVYAFDPATGDRRPVDLRVERDHEGGPPPPWPRRTWTRSRSAPGRDEDHDRHGGGCRVHDRGRAGHVHVPDLHRAGHPPLASLVSTSWAWRSGSRACAAGQVQKVAEEVKNNVNGRMTHPSRTSLRRTPSRATRQQVAADAHLGLRFNGKCRRSHGARLITGITGQDGLTWQNCCSARDTRCSGSSGARTTRSTRWSSGRCTGHG